MTVFIIRVCKHNRSQCNTCLLRTEWIIVYNFFNVAYQTSELITNYNGLYSYLDRYESASLTLENVFLRGKVPLTNKIVIEC